MYHKHNLLYVLTLLEIIEKVVIYTDNYQRASDLLEANDQINYNATIHLLLVSGEETKKIDDLLKDRFPDIPWKQIVSMRNYLAHDYRGVDPERVFVVVKTQLQPMKDALLAMLDLIDYETGVLKEALGSPYYQHIQYLRNKFA
ncbi:MAG: DUF86 domain-containing protein [Bacteroidetes bacterium]|nr:DUF86 domain-containing protein [Fibrella sp.]